jgi:hypothetical protein
LQIVLATWTPAKGLHERANIFSRRRAPWSSDEEANEEAVRKRIFSVVIFKQLMVSLQLLDHTLTPHTLKPLSSSPLPYPSVSLSSEQPSVCEDFRSFRF